MRKLDIAVILFVLIAAAALVFGIIRVNQMTPLEIYVADGGVGYLLLSIALCLIVLMRLLWARRGLSDTVKITYSTLLIALVVVTLPLFGIVDSRLDLVKGYANADFYITVYLISKFGYGAIGFGVVAIAAGIISGIVTKQGPACEK